MTESPRNVIRLLTETAEALSSASAAAGQLIHHFGNPLGFIIIRDAIDLTREGILKVARASRIIS